MMSLLVVGSLHWDVIVNAPHIPGRDETVAGQSVNYVFGGKGGNQAVAADQHGALTHFAGRIGGDAFGAQILNRLKQTNIRLAGLQRGEGASGMSVAIVDKNGDYGATIVSGENLLIDAKAILFPEDLGVLLLQNEIDEKVNLAVAKRAKEQGAAIWLNAAPARALDDELLQLLDVMIVNRVEAEFYKSHLADHVKQRITLIETQGGAGVAIHRHGQKPTHHDAFGVKVLSSHGAGDMFAGALAARHLMGQSMEDATHYAQAAAALHISSPLETRSTITPEQVLAFMDTR
ncbi:MAG: PfkB family carbohydrate kinase [Paracoccaceae bacterium]